MKLFRNKVNRNLFTFFAGITFLNMSFILSEVDALGLSKNSTLIQNIINSGIEEEKETSTEKAGDHSTNEILLSLQENLNHHSILFFLGRQRNKHLDNQSPQSGYTRKFSPPPESSIS
jgi:hypothetical protein